MTRNQLHCDTGYKLSAGLWTRRCKGPHQSPGPQGLKIGPWKQETWQGGQKAQVILPPAVVGCFQGG